MSLEAALAAVRRLAAPAPELAIVAGSGLGDLAWRVAGGVTIPFETIPGWPRSAVVGHAGELVLGQIAGRPVALASGRAHLYEGCSPPELGFGVRLMRALGARTLVVTNAAGGLDPALRPGEIVILADHIFLPGLAGANPLVGWSDPGAGPRFFSMAAAYDRPLRRLAAAAAAELGLEAREGVYAMVGGPSFETPAEARFLRAIGATVVGMSTAPEVVVARHLGMRVLGLALVTNVVVTDVLVTDDARGPEPADVHAEVLDVAAAAAGPLGALVEWVVDRSAPAGPDGGPGPLAAA